MAISEWISTAILVATVFAIIYGPIKAVKITRTLDDKRAKEQRRLQVFRDLMRTRQVQMDADHVFSLNLVEIEFYGEESIISAYRAYIKHLNTPLPAVDAQAKFFEDRHDLFIDMLAEIGKAVGYTFDKQELSRFGYAPVGWGNDQERQRMIQVLLLEVLAGKRPFPVMPMVGGPNSPFPSAPQVEEK